MAEKYDSLAHLKDSKTGKYDLKLHSKARALRKVSDYTGDSSKSEGWKQFSKTNSVSDRKPLLKSLVRHIKKDR